MENLLNYLVCDHLKTKQSNKIRGFFFSKISGIDATILKNSRNLCHIVHEFI